MLIKAIAKMRYIKLSIPFSAKFEIHVRSNFISFMFFSRALSDARKNSAVTQCPCYNDHSRLAKDNPYSAF